MRPKFPQWLTADAPAWVLQSWSRVCTRLRTGAPRVVKRIHSYTSDYTGGVMARRPDLARKVLAAARADTGLAVAFGAIAAVSGFFAIHAFAVAPFQQEVNRAANQVSAILTDAIDRHIGVAESAAALFSGPDANVNRWAFLEFSRTLPDENPGLSALSWIPRVSESQRGELEKIANADGLFDFKFTELGPDGERVEAARRPEYYPVYFVEPYVGNESLLGLDLAANKETAAFLANVRDTGKTVAATGGLAADGPPDAAGISIIVPAYRTRIVPADLAERRTALSGFVRASFRFDRLLETLPSRVPTLPEMEVYIFDRGDGSERALTHIYPAPDEAPANPADRAPDAFQGTYSEVDYEVAGRRWTIVVKAVPNAFQSFLGLTAWGFVAFTLVLTALLVRHLISMREAREQAEAANRAKSEFMAMMGHELRTPLNAVIGFSDMMVSELFGPLSNEHYKQYTAHINSSATHLLDLINNILDLSIVEKGGYVVDKTDFRLSENWRSVFSILEANIDSARVTVDADIANSSLELHADPVVFRQILLNLVSNAIKFTGEGGRIEVAAGLEADGRLALRVSDTGIGIAKEDLEHVFKPFQQADASLARKYEGVGVGLPLTRRLIELHGGELHINSRPGEGTDITVLFPAEIVITDGSPPEKPSPAPSDDGDVGTAPPRKRAGASGR